MNIILGSGIVGLLAKFLLGDNWKIIPFHKSRFFTFNPALDDNFIIRDKRLDEFICDVVGSPNVGTNLYSRAWSFSGSIINRYDNALCEAWLYKIFGNNIPQHSTQYYKNKMSTFIYDERVNLLYEKLLQKYMPELRENNKKVISIGEHYLVFASGEKLEFDNVVSTIPLNVLYDLIGIKHNLQSKKLQYLHVETEDLDFESANQLFVVDNNINFYKVTNIAPRRYLFYIHDELINPGIYLMQFMNNFDIIDGTSIDNVIPIGQMPDLSYLSSYGIYPIGSSAQWDWCMDVGSCVIRLMDYSQRGYKRNENKIYHNPGKIIV